MISDREVLTHLHTTRGPLAIACEHFNYSDWTECTTGRLCTATNGQKATSDTEVQDPTGRFAEVIQVVALALGWDGQVDRDCAANEAQTAVLFVSDYTVLRRRSPKWGPPNRKDALAVIDEAISVIEARLAVDRADVLAQLERVVDDAETPVAVEV